MPDDEPRSGKKEKVLHTRISESLDEEIRDQAQQLGVSVSNLVRNILQNAIGLVGDIVADTTTIANATKGIPPRPRSPAGPQVGWVAPATAVPVPRVIGWQEAVLALNGVCDRCNTILTKGNRAAIALFDIPGPTRYRCLACLREEPACES